MNSSILTSLPVKYVGGLVLVVVASIVVYLGAVFSVYLLAWIVELLQAIFG